MQTIKVDIINDKVMNLLKDLELLQLIRLHDGNEKKLVSNVAKYKGAMAKQHLEEVNYQLNKLRKG